MTQGQKPGIGAPSEHLEGTKPASTLILEFQFLELWDNTSVIYATQSVVLFYYSAPEDAHKWPTLK